MTNIYRVFYVRNGNILSFGVNHTIKNSYCMTVHSEIDALNKLNNRFKNKIVNMSVVRFNKSGKLTNSKPCYECIKYINEQNKVKIKNIYYSNEKGEIVRTTPSKLMNNTNHHSKGYFYKRK